MDVYECIRSRRTVRRFKPDPVPDAVVLSLLKAGRWAPSSRNQQPWSFIVVRERRTLEALGANARSGGFLAEAPLAIAIAMRDADQPGVDAGRALQQIELMAWSLGLGTCFVTMSAEENSKARGLLGIPSDVKLVTVVPFGYRPDDFKGSGRGRRPLAEVAHAERYGTPYAGA